MSDALEMLKAILKEKTPDDQVQALMAELTIASGKGAVAIRESSGAVTITGSQNIVGDNNQVVINQGTDPEGLAKMFRSLLQERQQVGSTPELSPEKLWAAMLAFLQDVENKFKETRLFHTKHPIILKDQYIPIQVTLEPHKRDVETLRGYWETEEELKRAYALKGGEEELKRQQIDWQKAKQKHQRIMVLADPGMGKSTLLRMETGIAAQREFQRLQENETLINQLILPLFLRLSELAKRSEELIEAIPLLIQRDYPNTAPPLLYLLTEKLKTGKCLLLLDALDEVPKIDRNRMELQEKLDRFIQNYPCSVICTSRIVGYDGNFLADRQEVEIVPFREAQIEQYVKTWFTNAAGHLSDPSVSATELMRELRSKPQVRGLVQNPLLLSLICSLYQEKGLTLPARRTQVYEKAVEYMLIKWSKEKREPREGEEDWADLKQELLENLAYQFSCENTEVFSRGDLRRKINQYLKGEDVPNEFRTVTASDLLVELTEQDGILQKLNQDDDYYLFLHRTFQEYLTALYLARAKDGIALAKEHFWKYDWHETISLMAGLMKTPLSLLKAITDVKDDIFQTQLLLAGRCVAECDASAHPLITETIDRIFWSWEKDSDFNFIQSVMVAIGRAQPYLLEKLRQILLNSLMKTSPKTSTAKSIINFDPASLLAVLRILGKIGDSSVIPDILFACHTEDANVWREIADALEFIGSPEALEALLFMYNSDSFVGRRRRRAWATIGIERLVAIIKDREIDPSMRKEGAWILGDRGDPEALAILTEILQNDAEKCEVRGQAAVGLGYLGDARACEILCKALKDEEEIAKNAAWALERLKHPDSVQALIEALQDNREGMVCQAAVALGNISEVSAVSDLITISDNGQHPVCSQVIKALAEIGHPSAITPLVQLLNNQKLRWGIISALGQIGTNRSVEILENALNQEGEDYSYYHISLALVNIGTPQAFQVLMSTLDKYNQVLRASVASALDRVDDPQVTQILAQYYEDENIEVRKWAIKALVQLDQGQGREALLSALFNPELQTWAGEHIRELDGSEVIKSLIHILRDKNIEGKIGAGLL